MTAEGQSDKMASDMEVRMKQRCVIEFLHAEKIAPNDIHRRLLNVYGDQTVDVSTVRRWVARFSSGDSDVKDKPRSGRPCTAVTPRNEERLDQLIRVNRRITTRELCTELTKLKARISRVRPEKKTTFLLQHDNARPHTILKTVEHIANLGWTVLPHPPYSPDLAPSDSHLFELMKDGLRGRFPSNNAVVQAVQQWATSAGADFYECSMQALVHSWRKCIANGGNYVEK